MKGTVVAWIGVAGALAMVVAGVAGIVCLWMESPWWGLFATGFALFCAATVLDN